MTDSASGIHTDNAGDGGGVADLIKGNDVTDGLANSYGVWVFAPYNDVVLQENTVTNVDVGLTAAGSYGGVPSFVGNTVDGESRAGSTGVYVTTSLFGYGDADLSATFTNNIVKNVADGIYAEEGGAKTQSATFTDNGFSGATNSLVTNVGTSVVMASGNSWGSNDESAVGALMSGDVDFTPFLDSATDTSADRRLPGCFDVLDVTHLGEQVGSTGRIQEGVDLVTDSIVNVGPGTYAETVIVTDPGLELRGANYGVSPNDPSDALSANPARGSESTIAVTGGDIAISVRAADVVVDGFRFTATGASNANVQSPVIGAGVNFGGDASGISITNNLFGAIQRMAVYFNGPDATPMQGATIDDNRVDHPTRPETGCNTAPDRCARQLRPPTLQPVEDRRSVLPAQLRHRRRRQPRPCPDAQRPGRHRGGGDGVTIADNTIRYACHFTCITLSGSTTNVSITGNDVISHRQRRPALQRLVGWLGRHEPQLVRHDQRRLRLCRRQHECGPERRACQPQLVRLARSA